MLPFASFQSTNGDDLSCPHWSWDFTLPTTPCSSGVDRPTCFTVPFGKLHYGLLWVGSSGNGMDVV